MVIYRYGDGEYNAHLCFDLKLVLLLRAHLVRHIPANPLGGNYQIFVEENAGFFHW